jgi:AraC-like DNA-binding protein
MLQEVELVDQLRDSSVYQDFEQAFCKTTRLALRLAPRQDVDLESSAHLNSKTIRPAIQIPVRIGDKVVGVLQLGVPVSETQTSEPGEDCRRLRGDTATLFDFSNYRFADSDSGTQSCPRDQAVPRLLGLFANQLSFFANEILIQQAEREPYRVRQVRAYISTHQTEDFALSDVARAVNVCPFYLCRIFKRATGLTIVEFRNRLRIESAKRLLAHRKQSVSEIAYTVGFRSLTQFNRLFRRIVGESPTAYRLSLSEACQSKESDNGPRSWIRHSRQEGWTAPVGSE